MPSLRLNNTISILIAIATWVIIAHGVELNLSNWDIGESQYWLPRECDRQMILFDEENGIINILGGLPNVNQLISYQLNPFKIIDYGLMALDVDMDNIGMTYTQLDNTLYFTAYDDFFSMDVSSLGQGNAIPAPTQVAFDACLTSMSLEHDYVFIIGGYKWPNTYDYTSIYDITNQTWITFASNKDQSTINHIIPIQNPQ